ncbi:hypothetical protein [Niabella hirudinis]|uniref:hypothetical protein n=1 Tax=Niabella hirudinis TaxID=1285929 RepID=UPI003EB8652B
MNFGLSLVGNGTFPEHEVFQTDQRSNDNPENLRDGKCYVPNAIRVPFVWSFSAIFAAYG